MARMRACKEQLKAWLNSDDWENQLARLAELDDKVTVGPLFSFLLLGEPMTSRAASALGLVVAHLAQKSPESARNIVRRCMWHMNEDSGNIGWGIPEAFAEILVRSPLLFREFHRVLISYIIHTGKSDNYCDHAPLRRSCYGAVGRLLQVYPQLGPQVAPYLEQGLQDTDPPCRAQAAWALQQMREPKNTDSKCDEKKKSQ
ncbi:MAG: HEAT repeat domain-containing protein [Desulfovibrionaceae bacterium]